MRIQAGVQIILVIIAGFIVVTVIRPEFDEIRIKQDNLASLNDAINKADTYNRSLSEKIARADSFPQADLAALNRFVPNEINPILIARDLATIVEENGLLLQDVTVGEESRSNIDASGQFSADGDGVPGVVITGGGPLQNELRQELTSQTFSVEAIGTYTDMKNMLAAIERNAYPFRIINFEFAAEGEESVLLFNYSVELQTFALTRNE